MPEDPKHHARAAVAKVSSNYVGPKDVGRAESLYRSAITKNDLDYAAQLLFNALAANPEHAAAFQATLAKAREFGTRGRQMIVRVSDLLGGAPVDAFLKSLAVYSASQRPEDALACAAEAQRAGLNPYAVTLATLILAPLERGEPALKSGSLARLTELLEACGALELAVRAARCATRLFPEDQSFREREKNLLASKYLNDNQLSPQKRSHEMLRDSERQKAAHRPVQSGERFDQLAQRYQQTHGLEDFRELVRALREGPAERRERALPVLEDGLNRFGDQETRWFVREIRLDRRWSELRIHRKLLEESPDDARLRHEHERLRQEILAEQIDHLYEVVSALPNVPERARRQLELAGKLFDADRHEEAIKQAQHAKKRPEQRLDAWVLMAKSFVQLGLSSEATECFQQILSELNSGGPQSGTERVLEAKYAYAEFLVAEAARLHDLILAAQARKLCSDVMIEDIDYREIRGLVARVEGVLTEAAR